MRPPHNRPIPNRSLYFESLRLALALSRAQSALYLYDTEQLTKYASALGLDVWWNGAEEPFSKEELIESISTVLTKLYQQQIAVAAANRQKPQFAQTRKIARLGTRRSRHV